MTAPTISTYTNLVPSANASAPKFMAMLAATLQPFVDLQAFTESVTPARDVDTAQWKQLDDLGEWVGLSRYLRQLAPGITMPPPPPGVTPLPDSDYRVLLRGKIGSNHWLGTPLSAYQKLTNVFAGSGSYLFISDNQDMSEMVAISGNVPSLTFQAALAGGYMQVRPAAVYAKYAFPTAPGGPLFGFGPETQFIAGFDHGVWASVVQ